MYERTKENAAKNWARAASNADTNSTLHTSAHKKFVPRVKTRQIWKLRGKIVRTAAISTTGQKNVVKTNGKSFNHLTAAGAGKQHEKCACAFDQRSSCPVITFLVSPVY